MKQVALKLSPVTRSRIWELLRRRSPLPGFGRGEVIEVFTALFGERVEADIRIVNGRKAREGPYLDHVLLHAGEQVASGGFARRLAPKYSFVHDGHEYVVVILKGD